MQPGMTPDGGMPAMQPGQAQPGGFGQTDAAAGMFAGDPNAAGQAPAGSAPFGEPGHEGEPLDPEHHMEHVSDFFGSESLGFDETAGGPETAGPGRLTIVGFVPKSTGSIKTTIIVAVAMLAVAAVVMTYVWITSKNKREIAKHFGDLSIALEQDRYVEYQTALEYGQQVLEIDDSHDLTLSAMAFTHVILAYEHGEDESVAKADEYIAAAEDAIDETNEWLVVAKALRAFHKGEFNEGLADIKDVAEKSTRPNVQLENFRLRDALSPNDEKTKRALKQLKSVVTGQARVYNALGWVHYMKDDWQSCDNYFNNAIQNVRGHEPALLGKALTDLDRGIGLKELQKEIASNIKKVLTLPQDELSQPVRALGYFARSQLRNWQGKDDEAKADYDKALKLDGKNAMFPYRRGVGEMKLRRWDASIKFLKQAVKLKHNNVTFLEKLVKAQIGGRDFAGAAATNKRCLDLDAENAECLLSAGDLLAGQKKYPEAIKAYEKIVLKTHGGKNVARAKIATSTALRGQKKGSTAVKLMEDFLKSAPASVANDPEMQARIWEELGLANESAGQKAKAEEAFKVGVEQFRYYPGNHCQVARIQKFKGGEAKAFCELYVTLAPRGECAAECKRKFKIK